jgi:hypothetical protein
MRRYVVIRRGRVWLVDASKPEHALGKLLRGADGTPAPPEFAGVVAVGRVTAPDAPPTKQHPDQMAFDE